MDYKTRSIWILALKYIQHGTVFSVWESFFVLNAGQFGGQNPALCGPESTFTPSLLRLPVNNSDVVVTEPRVILLLQRFALLNQWVTVSEAHLSVPYTCFRLVNVSNKIIYWLMREMHNCPFRRPCVRFFNCETVHLNHVRGQNVSVPLSRDAVGG